LTGKIKNKKKKNAEKRGGSTLTEGQKKKSLVRDGRGEEGSRSGENGGGSRTWKGKASKMGGEPAEV